MSSYIGRIQIRAHEFFVFSYWPPWPDEAHLRHHTEQIIHKREDGPPTNQEDLRFSSAVILWPGREYTASVRNLRMLVIGADRPLRLARLVLFSGHWEKLRSQARTKPWHLKSAYGKNYNDCKCRIPLEIPTVSAPAALNVKTNKWCDIRMMPVAEIDHTS